MTNGRFRSWKKSSSFRHPGAHQDKRSRSHVCSENDKTQAKPIFFLDFACVLIILTAALGASPFGPMWVRAMKSRRKKCVWELAPDPEAYQIFTRNYEKHEDGSENKQSVFSRIRPIA